MLSLTPLFLSVTLCFILLDSTAHASPNGNTPHPAVVRVVAKQGTTLSKGSGTLVGIRGEHGLIVTNWHVVREASDGIQIIFPDGFNSAATILAMDRNWDLAALLIWKPDVSPVRLAPTAAQRGDLLTIAGYGSGTYRAATGRVSQYVSPGRNFPFEMVEVSTQARQGDSGGPILNQRGELAGVLFGAARGTTSGSYSGRVRRFLATVWDDSGHRDDTMIARNEPRRQKSGNRGGSPSESRVATVGRKQPSRRSASTNQPQFPSRTNPNSQQRSRGATTNLPRDSGQTGPIVSLDPRDPAMHSRTSSAQGSGFVDRSSDYSGALETDDGVRFSWDSIQWGQFIGTTWPQQIKSILACIGVLALVIQFRRMSKE